MFNVNSYAINTNLSKNETLPHVRMSYQKGKKTKGEYRDKMQSQDAN